MMLLVTRFASAGTNTVIRQNDNILDRTEPFTPSASSNGLNWNVMEAAQRKPASAGGVLPNEKLRTVIEYIMENLAGSPTLDQMAAIVHLSPYHFARQFKAATGVAPHQYVIARRVERAQDLLRANCRVGLGEIAFRCGFAHQSHFCFHFKRIAGVSPRQFMGSERIP
jgi:AraC family transcriptional regulator